MKLIIDSIPQLIGLLLALSVAIGAFGTFIEMLGKVFKKPMLVTFGQKLEALGTDIPELVKGTKPGAVVTAAAFVLCFAFGAAMLTGCAFLKGSVWPVVASCAPSDRQLVAQVESILLAGGDTDSKLLAVGKDLGADGLAWVVCAVKVAVSELGSKIGASESSAAARGHAFLAKTGNVK